MSDTPPWDAWVGLYHDAERGAYLVSWVPPALLVHAADGIEANPVACILWLDEPQPASPPGRRQG